MALARTVNVPRPRPPCAARRPRPRRSCLRPQQRGLGDHGSDDGLGSEPTARCVVSVYRSERGAARLRWPCLRRPRRVRRPSTTRRPLRGPVRPPLDQLVDYRPARTERPDFDAFWHRTLDEQDAAHPLEVTREPVDTGLTQILTEDVTFTGFGGQPIKAWFHRPASSPTTGPVSGEAASGRWSCSSATGWARAVDRAHPARPGGYAVLVMDNRGQGSGHRVGHTGDTYAGGPHAFGYLTQGIEDPDAYYYRRLFTDAARAVEVARAHPAVDPDRVMVSGASQGGAICLAAAALSSLRGVPLRGAIVDVPFLAHVRRCTEITDAHPYGEIVDYLHAHRELVEQTFETVSYFDGMNFAPRIEVPALFSVGLRDEICPPSAVYAAYNHYAGPKEMNVYTYNGHEHGGPYQEVEHVRFAREVLG
ncbi:acetylxylan esterase [Oerskovia sp. M15]